MVKRSYPFRIIAIWGACAVVAIAQGANLPFSLENSDQWKPLRLEKEMSPGIVCETIITHNGAPDRLVIWRTARPADPTASLRAFGLRLKDSFTAYTSQNLGEFDAMELGYTGRRFRFELVKQTETLSCELFVFAVDHAWWGILYSKPAGSPYTAAAAFSLLRRNDPSTGTVAMDAYTVKNTPVSDFPLSIDIERSPDNARVATITVSGVPADSTTERAGVQQGDVVLSINGRKSTDYAAGVGKDTELGRIFLNRSPGDEIVLEIARPGLPAPLKVRLRVPQIQDRLRRSPFQLSPTEAMGVRDRDR